MAAVNIVTSRMIKSFFKGDETLYSLCLEFLDEAYGNDDSYSIRAWRTIRVGRSDAEPDFIIDPGEYGYCINIRTIHQLLEFHPNNRNELLEKAHVFRLSRDNTETSIVFVDSEIDPSDGKILDLGAVKENGLEFHDNNSRHFKEYVSGCNIVCGHNIVEHDLKYINNFFDEGFLVADTLLLSVLLFPNRRYHHINKDYKYWSFDRNNPMYDSQQTKALFYEEVSAFESLDYDLKKILYLLLKDHQGFEGFFQYINFSSFGKVEEFIRNRFHDDVCQNADFSTMLKDFRFELACVLMTIERSDKTVLFSPWILYKYPKVDDVIKRLRNTPCNDIRCPYCVKIFDVKAKLKYYFDFDNFRTFEGKPLQEQSVTEAVRGKSFIAVFPTGGGKSLTFQLPALIAGEAENALTVIISPLQALMKDQVDNLENRWKIDAVMINGLLDPVSRKEAIERIKNGTANILYISPEALRNNTIRDLIKNRVIARFVIDEAHCFSSWGQDFRVDYLYIGKFIKELQEAKGLDYSIPVSCFTATAGQKVLEDIHDYFLDRLGLEMKFILASPERKNLEYRANTVKTVDKYTRMRQLINGENCPTIVYVFSVNDTYTIAKRLEADGIPALPYNGQMKSSIKEKNQHAFLKDEVRVMVATTAFGMGVDKDNIGLVILYQAPASLEDYLQEVGRAGRSEGINGKAITLFNEDDVAFNFYFLNQTKLSLKDIQNVWRAIIIKSGRRPLICVSVEELAEAAGWTDNDNRDTSTSVTTAIGALENAEYVERLNNVFNVYATGIIPKTMEVAREMIDKSLIISEEDKLHAIRIMETLFTSVAIGKARNEFTKSTEDIANVLALEHEKVLHIIGMLREENILSDSQDMKAIISPDNTERKSSNRLRKSLQLEEFLMNRILHWEDETIDYKTINEDAIEYGLGNVTPKQIRAILMHWAVRKHVRLKRVSSNNILEIEYINSRNSVETKFKKRRDLSLFIIGYLYEIYKNKKNESGEIKFSLLEMKRSYEDQIIFYEGELKTSTDELLDALMYIQRIGALTIEGGFFVLNQRMKIRRLKMNNRIRYKKEDYKELENHYNQKGRQIHIMAEYLKILRDDPEKAKQLVNDYFALEPDVFYPEYFTREQILAMEKNISPEQYDRLFGHLSVVQKSIINDSDSQYIAVAAGPGSGKTMVLVHKLASLILLEDVKTEQLLMLTFSRLAATEFKKRLIDLIGSPAYFVEIKTFHSYCFDILGRRGNIDESVNIEREAVLMMQNDEIERERINKAVLVVDEAQDMSEDESNLINTMIQLNEDMRVILVGDDDQNIYEFRGSSSEHMRDFIVSHDASSYNLVENYRSDRAIVGFANQWAKKLSRRLKTEIGDAVSEAIGSVTIAKCRSKNLELPVIELLKRNKHYQDTCILTRTNAEAYLISGALMEVGINARLIQNTDGFRLIDVIEIRRFFEIIDEESPAPEIVDEYWAYARDVICEEFSESAILETCLNIIDGFEAVNAKKYKSDLIDYLAESQFEDFIHDNGDEVLVSTMHKAKGREYTNVYLVLNNAEVTTDEERRLLYVGCTRAKNNLYILYNNSIMDPYRHYATDVLINNRLYEKPERSVIHLSHKGVYLDSFIGKQEIIRKLHSGDPLTIRGRELWVNKEDKKYCIGCLSAAGLSDLRQYIYDSRNSVSAEVRFIVHWKKQETEKEYLIVLPTIIVYNNVPPTW